MAAARVRFQVIARALEGIACILFLAAGFLVLGRYIVAMGTTSLWTDEIDTILHYSGRGPLRTITAYHAPNNHIFFNLVNSVTPGRRSVTPLRARCWSFAAALGTLALAFAFFARRGAPAFGAFLFCLLAIQPELLDLILQARGYAFLCLFGLGVTVLTLKLFKRVERRTLVGLTLLSIVGAWTVPVFGFFAAPLWLLVVVGLRQRDVLIGAVASGAGILIVYAPVATQLVYQIRHYDEQWGHQYGTARAVGATVTTYLLHPSIFGGLFGKGGLIAAAFAGGVLLAIALWRNRREAISVSVVLGAVASFFGLCLILQTPLVRATAFIVVPLAFCTIYLLWVVSSNAVPLRNAVLALTAVVFTGRAVKWNASFEFLPLEAWEQLAQTLYDTFPEGTKFFVNDHREYLAGYLPAGYSAAGDFDLARIARGEELYLDTVVVVPPGGRIDGRKYVADALEFRIPQRRAGYQAIWLCPAPRAFLAAVRAPDGDLLSEVSDRKLVSGTSDIRAGKEGYPWMEFDLEKGFRYRSLVIVFAEGVDAHFSVRVLDVDGRPISPGSLRRSLNVALLHLRDQPARFIRLEAGSQGNVLPAIVEAWAYPCAGGPSRTAAR